MKLNFWQWIGAIIFVLGLVFLIVRESGKSDGKKTPNTPPAMPTPSNVPATTTTTSP